MSTNSVGCVRTRAQILQHAKIGENGQPKELTKEHKYFFKGAGETNAATYTESFTKDEAMGSFEKQFDVWCTEKCKGESDKAKRHNAMIREYSAVMADIKTIAHAIHFGEKVEVKHLQSEFLNKSGISIKTDNGQCLLRTVQLLEMVCVHRDGKRMHFDYFKSQHTAHAEALLVNLEKSIGKLEKEKTKV